MHLGAHLAAMHDDGLHTIERNACLAATAVSAAIAPNAAIAATAAFAAIAISPCVRMIYRPLLFQCPGIRSRFEVGNERFPENLVLFADAHGSDVSRGYPIPHSPL
jgi:hypothetical protein